MILTHLPKKDPIITRLGDGLLAERIQLRIDELACGRIRDLRVVCVEDLVILSGRSRTQHAKQLAQEAALQQVVGPRALVNQIIVN